MRKDPITITSLVLLGGLCAGLPAARAQDVQVKPYMMLILDSSGSMAWDDGPDPSPPNSCGYPSSPMNDAKCAVTRVIDSTGDAAFGLMQFDQPCSTSCCNRGASDDEDVWTCGSTGTCNDTVNAGLIRVPVAEDNQTELLSWVDNVCGSTCGTVNEIWARGATPLAGSLRRARWYFQGSGSGSLETPFYDDPYAACRPGFVILLTDGEETCSGNPATRAAQLRSTTVTLSGGSTIVKDIRTYVIGFRLSAPNAQIESIANSGGTDAPGPHRAFYADDEESLAVALSQIIADSVLVEVCDGADNNCNGLIDEGFPLYCDVHGGVPAPTLCVDPGETVCDGVDDNCNGLVDEGLTNACGTCGPAPTEICDGLDNDCDGIIDEGDVCAGCVPTPEICDGLDNDCDGDVDEGLTRPCGTDVGLCTPGTQTCTAGVWGACSGTGPTTEECNGFDDDCDGTTDGITRPCGPDTGACRPGTELCTDGDWGTCVGAVGPSPEVCDGIDNDCDGDIDEGVPGVGTGCGSSLGECLPGTVQCVGGSLVCVGGTSPEPEECNGLDDDCDGLVDDGIPSAGACGTGVGECIEGALTCVGGSFVCTGGRGPTDEECNGLDDDCDGDVDEGDPGGGGACGTDVGECTPGTLRCVSGSLTCEGAEGPFAEVCNGLDDDCNGLADDGLGVGAPCGTDTGECVPGRLVCREGAVVCEGDLGPVDEVCNGLDDDCDGDVDEDLGGGPCGTDVGVCMEGVEQCVSGRLACVGEMPPMREECDCADNDCDGDIDEEPDTGSLCPPGSACVDCGCALPCTETEFGFTCPRGRTPRVLEDDTCWCVDTCTPEECATETHPAGSAAPRCAPDDEDLPPCVCKGIACTFPCDGVVCADGLVCNPRDPEGRCVPDDCTGLGCPAGEVCDTTTGECESSHCEGVSCDDGEACRDGSCEPSCAAVECPSGERCAAGVCVTDRCDGVSCGEGERCDPETGDCGEDRCVDTRCPARAVCDPETGLCVEDPCVRLRCPEGEVCAEGECAATMERPDAGTARDAGMDAGSGASEGRRVLATGGGGCVCAAPGARNGVGSGEAPAALLVLLAIGLRLRSRGRRRRGRR